MEDFEEHYSRVIATYDEIFDDTIEGETVLELYNRTVARPPWSFEITWDEDGRFVRFPSNNIVWETAYDVGFYWTPLLWIPQPLRQLLGSNLWNRSFDTGERFEEFEQAINEYLDTPTIRWARWLGLLKMSCYVELTSVFYEIHVAKSEAINNAIREARRRRKSM